MPVLEVNELHDDDAGPAIQSDGNAVYHRSFEVITDVAMSGDAMAVYSGLPQLYALHNVNPFARVRTIQPTRHADADTYWTVRFEYSTKLDQLGGADIGQPSPPPPGGADPYNPDPLQRTSTYRFSSRKFTEYIINDINGVPLNNSAGDPYDPEPIEKSLLVVTVKKNLSLGVFIPVYISQFVGATNSLPFLNYSPAEALCDDLTAELMREKNVTFWEVQAVFVFNPIVQLSGNFFGGWKTRKIDAGWNELIGGVRTPITLPGNQKPAQPYFLDGAGRKNPTASSPVWKNWETIKRIDLNLLNMFP
jgi:hypothetical protein